jgi:signal transduction histidine kinase
LPLVAASGKLVPIVKFLNKERAFTAAMAIPAAIVIIMLAVLQYRWSNQVSEATSIRLADSLQMSMINWHLDLFRDFSEVCVALGVKPEESTQRDFDEYARRFAEWKKVTTHPDLVSNFYIIGTGDPSNSQPLVLDSSARHFAPGQLPSSFDELREDLAQATAKLAPEELGSAHINGLQDLRARDIPDEFANRFYAGSPLSGWRFASEIPALVHPVVRSIPASANRKPADHATVDWIVLALSDKAIQGQILPQLAQRYFRGTEGLDYQVAVVAGPGNLIYSSDANFGAQEVADADGTMNIFGRLQNKALGSPINIFHTPPQNRGPTAALGISWFPLLHEMGEDKDWRLVVRHRRGGALATFVADSRRRDLAISFGVLFLLVVSMVMLIVTSVRAQRFAKLQMDFVTAVSHELRTPLTVISSAAENIAHGVVEGKQQLEQYGAVIGGQAKRLFGLVEQILLFAAIREGHQRYTVRPLHASELIEAALSGTATLIQEAQFKVELEVDPNLPQIFGDISALSQCLQNLITNALKYGRDQHWIGIRAHVIEHGLSGKEIQITVADRGMGIESADLPHIFEPFYRSPLVSAAQIHGTGLGLPLARSIAEAMQGQLTVKSSPGRGSTFTLHLPCHEKPVRSATSAISDAIPS